MQLGFVNDVLIILYLLCIKDRSPIDKEHGGNSINIFEKLQNYWVGILLPVPSPFTRQ